MRGSTAFKQTLPFSLLKKTIIFCLKIDKNIHEILEHYVEKKIMSLTTMIWKHDCPHYINFVHQLNDS